MQFIDKKLQTIINLSMEHYTLGVNYLFYQGRHFLYVSVTYMNVQLYELVSSCELNSIEDNKFCRNCFSWCETCVNSNE